MPTPSALSPAGWRIGRTVGSNGVRFSALRDGESIGCLQVVERYRRQGVATGLLGQAIDWLRLGHVDRLLDYTTPDDEAYLGFLLHSGFRELTRTIRSWRHNPAAR